ncbi:MAG TPA: hypothetical protein VFN61_06315 [Acidimicrobiales bacterium]|nr:hypothetical protein [Acidimicrobiales bacterium]
MARRIEIELTSARPDGTWTWRAAGALNPKGSLPGSLLYDGAKAGDVVRVEAEFGMEGITVVSVEPPRTATGSDPNRIELLDRPVSATVTTQLASRSRSGERRQSRPGDRPPRGDRPERDRGPRPERGDAERGPRPERGTRPPRSGIATERPGARQPGEAGRDREGGTVPSGAGPKGPRERTARPDDGTRQNRRPPTDASRPQGGAGRQRRLVVANNHRNAMLESLPAEQRPIAQQLLRGGIPQVRTALFLEREKAREEGRPEPSSEGVLSIAESLAGRVKAAEWRDRAEAAVKAGDDLSTRDLRLLVNGSDVARDEASRELVVSLREMLERRVEAHRQEWSNDVSRLLDEGHTLRAVRLSSRPPDPGARFSAELATRLRDAAGSALSGSVPSDKWLAMLQAISESPVRRAVKPSGLPEDPSPELLETARQQCGRVPGLAPLLGLSVPPPPPPTGKTTTAVRPTRRPPRPPRPGSDRGQSPKGQSQKSRAAGTAAPQSAGNGTAAGDPSAEAGERGQASDTEATSPSLSDAALQPELGTEASTGPAERQQDVNGDVEPAAAVEPAAVLQPAAAESADEAGA